jgi:hypothetical protein
VQDASWVIGLSVFCSASVLATVDLSSLVNQLVITLELCDTRVEESHLKNIKFTAKSL